MAFLGFQSCRLPARKGSKRLQNSKPPGPGPQQWDFLWISKLPFASPQRLQTFQNKIPNTFPNRHPKAKATSPTGTPGPGHSNGFLRLSKLPFASPQTLQNSKPSKPSKTRQTLQTPSPAGTSDPPQVWTLSSSKPSKPLPLSSFPSTPGPGPQQWLSMSFQSCRLPARKGSKRLQNSKPPGPGPQQWDFLWISKLPFASPQRLQTFQNKIPNTFPNRHPRAKATSPTGTPGPGHSNGFLRLSKLPFASPQTLQNSPNPPNPPKPAKPSKHRPQQAPQIHRRCGPCPLPNPPNLYP